MKNTYENADFLNDAEKMRDFYLLSKEDFLFSYSYLTEEEYDNTVKAVESSPCKWLLTASKDGINVDFETIIASETEPDFWTCYEIADAHDCTLWSVEQIENE